MGMGQWDLLVGLTGQQLGGVAPCREALNRRSDPSRHSPASLSEARLGFCKLWSIRREAWQFFNRYLLNPYCVLRQ